MDHILAKTPTLAPAPALSPAAAKRQARQFRASQQVAANRTKEALTALTPAFVNWDYQNWREVWRAIRHAMIGEIAIKAQGNVYLPQPDA